MNFHERPASVKSVRKSLLCNAKKNKKIGACFKLSFQQQDILNTLVCYGESRDASTLLTYVVGSISIPMESLPLSEQWETSPVSNMRRMRKAQEES